MEEMDVTVSLRFISVAYSTEVNEFFFATGASHFPFYSWISAQKEISEQFCRHLKLPES